VREQLDVSIYSLHFGFTSIDQLKRWFDDLELDNIFNKSRSELVAGYNYETEEQNVVDVSLAVYEVDESLVASSMFQCVFPMDDAVEVERVIDYETLKDYLKFPTYNTMGDYYV
jgi:hypothetical protein